MILGVVVILLLLFSVILLLLFSLFGIYTLVLRDERDLTIEVLGVESNRLAIVEQTIPIASLFIIE